LEDVEKLHSSKHVVMSTQDRENLDNDEHVVSHHRSKELSTEELLRRLLTSQLMKENPGSRERLKATKVEVTDPQIDDFIMGTEFISMGRENILQVTHHLLDLDMRHSALAECMKDVLKRAKTESGFVMKKYPHARVDLLNHSCAQMVLCVQVLQQLCLSMKKLGASGEELAVFAQTIKTLTKGVMGASRSAHEPHLERILSWLYQFKTMAAGRLDGNCDHYMVIDSSGRTGITEAQLKKKYMEKEEKRLSASQGTKSKGFHKNVGMRDRSGVYHKQTYGFDKPIYKQSKSTEADKSWLSSSQRSLLDTSLPPDKDKHQFRNQTNTNH